MAIRVSVRGARPAVQLIGAVRLSVAMKDDPGQHSQGEMEAQRQESARLRDLAADARDVAADLRDQEAARREQVTGAEGTGAKLGAVPSAAAAAREHAASDRAHAADDRRRAAEERLAAQAYCKQVRTELLEARSDSLTGAHSRELGRATLQQEIDRARRSGEPFALAFVDVDGLKELNDREGHAAGDSLLRAVGAALRTGRRSYDPVVRIGGDEFLCGFTNTTLADCRRRIDQIRAVLEREVVTASISVGVAMLDDRDTLEKLIARADADMYSRKQGGRI
jgi:diguanylate cyclase (GGDEF)-like protein